MQKILFSALTAMSLSACTLGWNPSYMPAGYTYHHEEYKAPPGREAPEIGYEYSEEKNTKKLDQWRHAIRDLLLRARAHDLNLPPVFALKTDLAPSAFQSSFDFILREGLRAYGYKLTDAADAPVIFYTAFDPDYKTLMVQPPSTRTYNDDLKTHERPDLLEEKYNPEEIELVLAVLENGFITDKTAHSYNVPLSGYEPGAYKWQFENPLAPEPIFPKPAKDDAAKNAH